MTPAERRAAVRLRDRVAWALTCRVGAIRSLRRRWATRHDRPGFRARDF